MAKCQQCPVKGEDIPCRGEIFCRWMAVDPPDPVHVMHVKAVASRDASQPITPQPGVVPCNGSEATVIHAAPPGLLQKAASFGKAIVTHAIAGFPEAEEEIFRSRLAICRGCDYSTPEPLTCLKCGCGMEIKARWLEQACPIGKW